VNLNTKQEKYKEKNTMKYGQIAANQLPRGNLSIRQRKRTHLRITTDLSSQTLQVEDNAPIFNLQFCVQ
jgi:hypothetical protein